jgi:hypothetical protein
MMINKISMRGLVIGAATMLVAGSAFAESTTVYAQMVTVPTAPSTNCYFKIYVNPVPSSLASWGSRVYYDNTKILMQGAGYTNLSGEPGLVGLAGPETADTVTHPGETNVYRNYVCDSMPSLFPPSNGGTWNGDLIRLNFVTTPGYVGPASSIRIYINAQPGSDMIDDNLVSITDTYANASTVFLAPVTVSGFSIE